MGSVFKNIPGKTIKGFAGKEYQVPFYLQFVPGYVVDVVHSDQSLKYAGPSTINTIIAMPHITDKTFNRRVNAMTGEHRRYYPLFRTMHDVPSKGDPVLLCTIGKTNYYLGPLNTMENSPTWNDDPNHKEELSFGKDDESDITSLGLKNQSPNFNKETHWNRLHKRQKDGGGAIGFDLSNSIYETSGDTLIEGRHGNSIRIGSRNTHPYVFISNGRSSNVSSEGLNDGSLISITRRGNLALHLGSMTTQIQGKDIEQQIIPFFQVASDTVPKDKLLRPLDKMVTFINNDEGHLYSYAGDQMLFNSDRITLNSKFDDIYLSSIKDIHMGAGRHLTISTNNDVIIESGNIYLGTPIINPSADENPDRYFKGLEYKSTTANDIAAEKRMQPIVLGQQLFVVLKELITILSNAQCLCNQSPYPLVDETGLLNNTIALKLDPLMTKLEKIVSNKHFIEPNE